MRCDENEALFSVSGKLHFDIIIYCMVSTERQRSLPGYSRNLGPSVMEVYE